MARTIGKLTALKVSRLKTPGLHGDGGGLWLQVSRTGTKSWLYRFMLHGRPREMGLGALHAVSLADARAAAAECRKSCRDGIDPIEARKAQRAAVALSAARSKPFKECAASYIEAHRAGWKNATHISQWENTLKAYVDPIFGSLPAQAIDTGLVLKVLEPIWTTKTETASRVRGRIEAVLDWAAARGYRRRDNPARWRGHLENLLPKRDKVRKVKHHPALPYDELPDFMAALRTQDGVPARALELLILTAARTGEVKGAQPGEIRDRVWTVPADRIKGGKEHRVPLSGPALAVLGRVKDDSAKFIFPGGKRSKPLSKMALLVVLERMGRTDLTVHGFRSTFRDWAAERTNYPREVAEMALAHTIAGRTEAAYRRGDLFAKRQRMMEEWGRYCATTKVASRDKVVSIAAKR